jgi:hypothetical protein
MSTDENDEDLIKEWGIEVPTPTGPARRDESSYTAQCPACKRLFHTPIRHKLMVFDLDPSWGIGPRLWICEETVDVFRRMVSTFDISGPRQWSSLIRLP